MGSVTKVDALKGGVMAALVAGSLLAGGGSTLAAGKLGGASGMDVAGRSGPVLAGKLGGSSGADEFQLADPDDVQADAIVLGGKIAMGGGGE